MVALRIELSAIRLSDGYGLQPSTTISSSRAPRGRTEILLLPKQACSHLHLCPNRWRVVSRKPTAEKFAISSTFNSLASTALRLCRQWTCRELNPEALSASQSADPSASPFVVVSDSCGIRTRPAWLERPVTSPEVERAVVGYVGAHF